MIQLLFQTVTWMYERKAEVLRKKVVKEGRMAARQVCRKD
jgi:hypothetical protein